MFGFKNATQRTVESTVERILREALTNVEALLGRVKSITDLEREARTLRESIEALTIEKGRKEEEFAKKEREVEHMVGLERKRQEFEIQQAKREAQVSVREENLKADRERFEQQLKFHDERFSTEVGYLKDTLAEMLKRLPTAEIKVTRRG